MSERFTASNGWYVEDQWLHNPQGARGCRVNAGAMLVTAIEYGRHLERTERDVELGRWRSKEHPDYVVYLSGLQVRVVDEGSGSSGLYDCRPDGDHTTPWAQVAREFFDAQEPPKPWLDAQPGEVWVLTEASETLPWEACVRGGHRAGTSVQFVRNGRYDLLPDSPNITVGRRIWPEPSVGRTVPDHERDGTAREHARVGVPVGACGRVGGGAVSTRDELAGILAVVALRAVLADIPDGDVYDMQADVLIAEDWRKMPSREALRSAIAEYDDPASHDDGLLDAILALMGNPEPPISETGERP